MFGYALLVKYRVQTEMAGGGKRELHPLPLSAWRWKAVCLFVSSLISVDFQDLNAKGLCADTMSSAALSPRLIDLNKGEIRTVDRRQYPFMKIIDCLDRQHE